MIPNKMYSLPIKEDVIFYFELVLLHATYRDCEESSLMEHISGRGLIIYMFILLVLAAL